MKKLFLLLFVCSFAFSQSNNVDTTLASNKSFFATTLTGSVDTVDIAFDMDALRADVITIVATSSAVDTVSVFALAKNGTTWIPMGGVDLTSNANVASVFGTTTTKEIKLNAIQPYKIRLVSLSDDGSTCAVIVNAKRQFSYEN
jgi:hypothetical protein